MLAAERSTPDVPPPGGDANERPPPPPGTANPDNEGGYQEPPQDQVQPDEAPVAATVPGKEDLDFASFSRQPLKPGQRKGRVLADELTDGAIKAGADAMAKRKDALFAIIKTSRGFDEMRARIKKLYAGARPSELRKVVEQSMIAAQLLGHAGARADRHEDAKR